MTAQKLEDWSLCVSGHTRTFTFSEFLEASEFPEHIKHLVQKEKEQEEEEKRQREIERNTCKVSSRPLPGAGALEKRLLKMFCSLLAEAFLHASGQTNPYGE